MNAEQHNFQNYLLAVMFTRIFAAFMLVSAQLPPIFQPPSYPDPLAYFILKIFLTPCFLGRDALVDGGGGNVPSKLSEIVGFSEMLLFVTKLFRAFAIGKDNGFEFYRKIFELGPKARFTVEKLLLKAKSIKVLMNRKLILKGLR